MRIPFDERYQREWRNFVAEFVLSARQDGWKGGDAGDWGCSDMDSLEDACIEPFEAGSLLFAPQWAQLELLKPY